MTRYRTVVADPPWQIGDFPAKLHGDGSTLRTPRQTIQPDGRKVDCPYPTMSVEEITALPVPALAEGDAHLYLWTTNQFLEPTYDIARAWGFRPIKILVWCKAPKGRGLGGSWASATEYVMFCRRGSLKSIGRVERNWWEWPRGAHSKKPEAFLDLVERVSPGPYLELFARRARFGWSYWGDESLGTADLPSEAA